MEVSFEQRREELGYSLDQLARKFDLPPSFIANLEEAQKDSTIIGRPELTGMYNWALRGLESEVEIKQLADKAEAGLREAQERRASL